MTSLRALATSLQPTNCLATEEELNDQAEAKRIFYRERYIRRCQDPEYRAKIAAASLARYYARKARDAEAGVPPKQQGRPRKYVTPPMAIIV